MLIVTTEASRSAVTREKQCVILVCVSSYIITFFLIKSYIYQMGNKLALHSVSSLLHP